MCFLTRNLLLQKIIMNLKLDDSFERMPVPASFNDITERREIRDFSGWVWYDRKYFVPNTWTNGSILLRFCSVNYLTSVYVNGEWVMNHTGGHLPFQADITKLSYIGTENHISVAVNNVLSNITLPQGRVILKNDTRKERTIFAESIPNFDFFNYAGIHRSVWLSYVPNVRIIDINVTTSTLDDLTTGVIEFEVKSNALYVSLFYWKIALLNRKGQQVVKELNNSVGKFILPDAKLWWPFTMNLVSGYMYTMTIRLYHKGTDQLIDSYRQKVGIRKVELTQKAFVINGKPVYFRGFGKHEDMNVSNIF